MRKKYGYGYGSGKLLSESCMNLIYIRHMPICQTQTNIETWMTKNYSSQTYISDLYWVGNIWSPIFFYIRGPSPPHFQNVLINQTIMLFLICLLWEKRRCTKLLSKLTLTSPFESHKLVWYTPSPIPPKNNLKKTYSS